MAPLYPGGNPPSNPVPGPIPGDPPHTVTPTPIPPVPNPVPVPNPAPIPITIVHDADWVSRFLAIVAIGIAWFAYLHTGSSPNPSPNPMPTPVPSVNLTTIGHSYGVQGVLGTLADAYDVAGTSIGKGTVIADAQTTFDASWDANRKAAFAKSVAPSLETIIPSGTVPTAAQLPAIEQAFHDLATGLRQAK